MSIKQQELPSKDQFASDILWPNFYSSAAIDQQIVSKYLANIPSHWLPLLLPFEDSTPEEYYSEEVFALVSKLLADTFDNDIPYFEKCLSYFANELDSAYASHQRATQLICNMPTPEVGRELRLRQYVFPTYQELIEAIWRPLARFCVIALEKPSETDFEKYSNYGINDIESKLFNRHSKFELLSGFDRVLRNNIAHHKFEFSDDVMKQDIVVLHDPTERDISDDEIELLVIDLYDTCSAILYGILQYGALSEHKLSSIPFGHYIRSQIVIHAVQGRRISIEKNTFVETNSGRQRNLVIRYDYPCDARVLMFVLSVLKLAVRFLPSDEYCIIAKPKEGTQYIWIRTTYQQAFSFVHDKLTLFDYLKTGDVQTFKNCTRKPRLPAIVRFLQSFLPNLFVVIKREVRYLRGWSEINIGDDANFSTGTSGRYRVHLVQHRDLSKEEVHRIIKKVVNKKQALLKHLLLAIWDMLRLIIKKKIIRRPPVNVILIHLWKKEKRFLQIPLDPKQGHPLCICCAEWNRNESFLWLHPSDRDERIGNLIVRWF